MDIYDIKTIVKFLKSRECVTKDNALACDVNLSIGHVDSIFAGDCVICSTKEGFSVLGVNVKDIISLCEYLLATFPDFRKFCTHLDKSPVYIIKKTLVLSRNLFGETDNTKDVYFITNGSKYLKMIDFGRIGDITKYFKDSFIIPIKWTNINDALILNDEERAKELLYNLLIHYNRCNYDCNEII